jgi:hypothetical protein
MSVYYKNLKTTLDGQVYYANSVSISEGVEMQDFTPLGTTKSYSFPSNKPEGSVDIDFYVTSSSEITKLHDQLGQIRLLSLSVGPFSTSQALVSSFSVRGEPNNILQASASFTYYGQMSKGSTPAQSNATIDPAHGASSTVSLSEVGMADVVSFDYSFSQSHEVKYSLGDSAPSKIIFNEATKEMELSALMSDVTFSKTNLTGANELCSGIDSDGVSRRNLSITLKDLCSSTIETLEIDGYLTSRDITAEPGGEAIETVNVTEKYVPNGNCPSP